MYTLAVKSGILKCEGAGDIEEDGAICIFLVGGGGERQGRDSKRDSEKYNEKDSKKGEFMICFQIRQTFLGHSVELD